MFRPFSCYALNVTWPERTFATLKGASEFQKESAYWECRPNTAHFTLDIKWTKAYRAFRTSRACYSVDGPLQSSFSLR
jgi:hypothetical protein